MIPSYCPTDTFHNHVVTIMSEWIIDSKTKDKWGFDTINVNFATGDDSTMYGVTSPEVTPNSTLPFEMDEIREWLMNNEGRLREQNFRINDDNGGIEKKMTKKYEEIIIFGCGGVGSWVANFIARQKLCGLLILVDFDVVEEKNIARQCFNNGYIGVEKVHGVKHFIEKINSEMIVEAVNKKIIDDVDLAGLNKDAVAIICTDNMRSKREIAKHFTKFLLVHCDNNFVEIKTFLDNSDLKSWDLGGGYSNEQTLFENVHAANIVVRTLQYWSTIVSGENWRYFTKLGDEQAKIWKRKEDEKKDGDE